MPISEMQARLFIGALKGYIKLPNQKQMEKNLKKKREQMAKEFVASRRHTIQVYYVDYMDELAKLIGCRPSYGFKFLYDPNLAVKLYFHGVLPYQYRLQVGYTLYLTKFEFCRVPMLGKKPEMLFYPMKREFLTRQEPERLLRR